MLRILLAEDVVIVRGAIATLLEFEHDLTVVAQTGDGGQIVPLALETRPTVAVIDIGLPGLDGLSAAADLHRKLPECRTLILTSLGRPGTLRRAMAASVSGFLLKDTPSDQLAQAIREVAGGRRVIDPHLAVSAWDAGEVPLSNREIQVLRLAASGTEPQEIAAVMHISLGTVRNYLTKIVSKLNARNRIDAIRIATEAGWI